MSLAISRQKNSSRVGKKQVIAYIPPVLSAKVERLAFKENKTKQELIAEALNIVLEENGYKPFMPMGHDRIIRRYKNKASTRNEEGHCPARRGKQAFCGWFLKDYVENLSNVSRELERPIQSLLEEGLKSLLESK